MGVYADRLLLRDALGLLAQERVSLRVELPRLVANIEAAGLPVTAPPDQPSWQRQIARTLAVRRKTLRYLKRGLAGGAARTDILRVCQSEGITAGNLAADIAEFEAVYAALESAPKSTVAQCRAALLAAAASPATTSAVHGKWAAIVADESGKRDLFYEEPP